MVNTLTPIGKTVLLLAIIGHLSALLHNADLICSLLKKHVSWYLILCSTNSGIFRKNLLPPSWYRKGSLKILAAPSTGESVHFYQNKRLRIHTKNISLSQPSDPQISPNLKKCNVQCIQVLNQFCLQYNIYLWKDTIWHASINDEEIYELVWIESYWSNIRHL
jgi:hypothetical protein